MNAADHSHFESQARACERLGSPFTARLCRLLPRLLDGTTATGRRALNWPGRPNSDALALRLCGGLHALVLAGRDAELVAAFPPRETGDDRLRKAVSGAISRHDDYLDEFIDSPPQTNEIARSAMLLPGLLAIARETGLPLAIREIGASGGLNLNLDRFGYVYGDAGWGDEASPVGLAPEIRGGPPPLDGRIEIASRAGCDLMPVDIGDPAERLRLKSYIWADQAYRLRRLDAAIAIAEANPFRLEKDDARAFVERELVDRPRDVAFVLFHSIMWQYLPESTKAGIEAAMRSEGARAAASAPLAHLRMEPAEVAGEEAYAALSLTLWPGGPTRRLARCDFHGRWIEWEG